MKNFMKAAFLSVAMLFAREAGATTVAEFNALSTKKQTGIIRDAVMETYEIHAKEPEQIRCIADRMFLDVPELGCPQGFIDIIQKIDNVEPSVQVEKMVESYLLKACIQ